MFVLVDLTNWLKLMVHAMKNDESTERRIMEAAKQVFLEKGYDGARMQEIADAANINKAMVHYYFRSKDKLFTKIFEDIMENNVPRLAETILKESNFESLIKAFVRTYITILQANPFAPLFIFHEMSRNPDLVVNIGLNIIRPKLMPFMQMLASEIKSGKYKDNLRTEDVMLNIIGLCIYPFIARPMIQTMLGLNNEDFDALIESRKETIPEVILASLKR